MTEASRNWYETAVKARNLYKSLTRSVAPDAPPLAMVGRQKIPFIGVYYRLKAVITQPTQLAVDCYKEFGEIFTIRIPFAFDLTYIINKDAYRLVLEADHRRMQMGPVMAAVPTVGYWYPRAHTDSDHLQDLLLVGRAFMASYCFGRARFAEKMALLPTTYQAHFDRWQGREVDLSTVVWQAIYDAAARAMVGDEIWDEIGEEVAPLFRDIADGINIPRTTHTVMPYYRLTREYRATRKLQKVLDRLVTEHRQGKKYEFIEAVSKIEIKGKPIDPRDVSWMIMYVLWNGVSYPGSYGFWTLVDALTDSQTLAHARSEGLAEKDLHKFFEHCFLETVRLNPISSLVRVNTQPIQYQSEGRTYRIRPGGYVGVLPYQINRDAKVFEQPDRYDPFRYSRGEALPQSFGQGAFGCPARNFSTALVAEMLKIALRQFEFELRDPVPARICRVHLTYPEKPLRAMVRSRAGRSPQALPHNQM